MNELFYPKSIAIVGASNKIGKVGNTIISNLSNYRGKIYLINPNDEKINGITAYKNISQIKENIDLVIIAIPKEHVLNVIKEINKAKYIMIISVGFKESGNYSLEKEILENAKGKNLRIIGPNVLGHINNDYDLNTIFIPKQNLNTKKSDISIISQSGTVGAVLIDELEKNNLGLQKFISYGNASDLNESDFLEYLENDKETKYIAAYIEEIIDPQRFIAFAKKTKKKIIILKAGLTNKGLESAKSHTGALSTDRKIYEGIFKQYKIRQAYTISDIVNVLKGFKIKPFKDLCIITNGGGYGIMLSDELENFEFTKTSNLKLNLPIGSTNKNPIDILGDAKIDRYLEVINKVKSDLYIVTILGQVGNISKEELEFLCKKIEGKNVIFLCTYDKHKTITSKYFPTFTYPREVRDALIQI